MVIIYFVFSLIGTPINKRPVLGYRNLNLFKLFRLVHKLGGFDNVSITVRSETCFSIQHVFLYKNYLNLSTNKNLIVEGKEDGKYKLETETASFLNQI